MREWLKAQYKNLFLWIPLVAAFGIALYFSLFSEPTITSIICIFIFGITSAILFRKFPIIVLLSFFAIGFGYVGIYTHIKSNTPIAHDIHGIEISGKVSDIDYANNKVRIYLTDSEYGNIRVSATPGFQLSPGDTISGTGGLFKPKPADIPNGFDFARWAYFDNISATGYLDDIKIVYTADSGVYSKRDKIRKWANSFLTDSLILGYKHALPDGHADIWATNGVAHIWSISGYHLTLVIGWLFVIFYSIFRLCPKLVRRVPARIPALICSWVGLVFYVMISGASVATIRAFIMATLVILAFIMGRNAISLRMASIAFMIIIIMNPHYVMHPGFQLSFSAIFGLIWLWQSVKPKMPKFKPLKYGYSAILTAITATIFTAPFVLAHFGKIPIYGILGNLIFLPIFSFVIMPLVFVGTICKLCGISYPLSLAHITYDHAFKIAQHISNMSVSNISPGIIPKATIITVSIGLACLIFICNIDRFKYLITRHLNTVFAGIFICTGIIIWVLNPKPIFYISHNHKLVGAIIDGKLKFNKSRDSSNFFAFDTWKIANGELPETTNHVLPKKSGVYRISYPEFDIVYIQNFVALSKNITNICHDERVKYIVSYFDVSSTSCSEKIIHGGGVIYPSGTIKYVSANRPWHNRHE